MTRPNVAVLVGSLSARSINQRLSLALQAAGSEFLCFAPVDISYLPLYNRDLDGDLPPAVKRLKKQVEAADGLLLVTPEYNRSVPSVLKNALDWGSRPYGASAWRGKVAAVAGASTGALGTAVAQTHLRTILTHLDILTLPQPELYVKVTDALLSETGDVLSPDFERLLVDFMQRFAAMIGSGRA
ncbi:NADPH-dependent FMN reductase [Nitratireductor soli]|uniref:NADPH-dependent FMN reductase n=1 Tax=Nitratireductor soli TaxID=1670619 RepID=UPI00065E289E|nr:NADPH-dependent FMN reductase [Nitratireductor soli]